MGSSSHSAPPGNAGVPTTGAIFHVTRYGSTAQFAQWIGAASGLPAHQIKTTGARPESRNFLVLSCPVIFQKLPIARWLRRNTATIAGKPVILFTVSGAPAGAKLNGWIAGSLPADFIAHMEHLALGGRQDPKELSRYDRAMLIIGSLMNRDRKAAREELHGFDFMDTGSIGPVVDRIRALQSGA